jgi:hypothetical protein
MYGSEARTAEADWPTALAVTATMASHWDRGGWARHAS